MFVWFVGMALVIVWAVFRDPAIDYRLVVVGVLLPDAVDGLTGGTGALHSLTGSVVLLAVVMLGTIGRRSARRRLIALPIGTFLHLVLDGVFTDTAAFWWPFSGAAAGVDPLPSWERGWWNVLLEVIGLGALAWFWRRFDLGDPECRRLLWRTGHLDRRLTTP